MVGMSHRLFCRPVSIYALTTMRSIIAVMLSLSLQVTICQPAKWLPGCSSSCGWLLTVLMCRAHNTCQLHWLQHDQSPIGPAHVSEHRCS